LSTATNKQAKLKQRMLILQAMLKSFFGAFKNIPDVLGSRREELIAVHLAKTYCLSSLLYSTVVKYGD